MCCIERHLQTFFSLHSNTDCISPGYFLCKNEKCIAAAYHCDGTDDCGDGSDELGCSKILLFIPAYISDQPCWCVHVCMSVCVNE